MKKKSRTVHLKQIKLKKFIILSSFFTDAQGKVKTVAELEGELQAKKSVRSVTPPGRMNRESPQSGNDLTAFNKLISLMQAGAARPVESPKQPVSVGQCFICDIRK